MAKKIVHLSGSFAVVVDGSSNTSAYAEACKILEDAFPCGIVTNDLNLEDVYDA